MIPALDLIHGYIRTFTMLLIPCPNCGPRDESEFTYGGVCRPLPALDGHTTAQEWHDALHLRQNPRGAVNELWYHSNGCECWVKLIRDTATHDFMDDRSSEPETRGA